MGTDGLYTGFVVNGWHAAAAAPPELTVVVSGRTSAPTAAVTRTGRKDRARTSFPSRWDHEIPASDHRATPTSMVGLARWPCGYGVPGGLLVWIVGSPWTR